MANISSSNGIEKYPKLRFPQFSDAWQQAPLSKYLEENTERNRKLTYDKTDVLSVSGEFGIVNQIALQGRSFAGESVAEYHIVYAGDIVYTKSPLKANPYGIIKTNNGIPGIVSTLYAVYHPLSTVVPRFVEYYFCNNLRLNKFLKPLVNIGAKHDMKVNNEFVLTGDVTFPSFAEQQRIVDFLSVIDKKIEKQQMLVENLKKYKRGVVKTLLNPRKNKRPGVKWSTDTIGNLGNFIKGAPLSKADIADVGSPFILYGELYTTYREVVRHVVRKTEAHVDDVYLSQIGDVVIPTSGESPEEISTASCIMIPNVILAGDLNIYRGTTVDGRIMSYLLNHIVNEQIARVAQGKSVVHVQASEICKIAITYPDQTEQERIAQILELTDKRITMLEESLFSIQSIKNALLQQLFI